jgi:hypothetical protein
MSEFDRSPTAQASIQMELDPPPASQRFDWRRAIIAPVVFLLLTSIVFGRVLFTTDSNRVAAAPGTDLTLQFIAWRQFGFSQLAHGNLALWNPHIFGGTPYFAGFQSALLYPPNWLHLVMPLGRAINWITALHVFLAGYFTHVWCRYRGASIGGAIIAGAMFMFGGPYFLHVYAGHLPHVAVIVWIPLVLLAIDGLIESGAAKWWLMGTVALAMQILAGHPQYVYYTGIVATIYLALRLLQAKHHLKAIAGFGLMYVAAVLVSAVQLLPGLALTSETVRSGGLKYEVASTFSLPPENFLTMLVPNLFGTMSLSPTRDPSQEYFGRCYLWEVSVFVSLTGVLLAIIGAIGTKSSQRRFALSMVIICFVLALGRHTPLYWPMFKYLPQYGSFRGTTKFAVFGVAFVSLLAAMGFDRLRKEEGVPKWPVAVAGAFAVVLGLGWLMLGTQAGQGSVGLWGQSLKWIGDAALRDRELFTLPPQAYVDAQFISDTARNAARATLWPALVAAIAAAILFATTRRPVVAYALAGLVALEMLIFAWRSTATMSIEQTMPDEWQQAMARGPVDARVLTLDMEDENAGMCFGFDNLWGYDPGVLKRYAELIYATQGIDPNEAGQYPPFRDRLDVQLFPMLRCALLVRRQVPMTIQVPVAPLPTALLVRNYMTITDRNALLTALRSSTFDPKSTVLLESQPDPPPQKGSTIGGVEILSRTTDTLELKAQLDTPALFLVTNNYAQGWRARPMEPNTSQKSYTLMPANWALQAIPLAAGNHHLLLEYRPSSFVVGKWVSILSLVGLTVISALLLMKSRRRIP